VAVPESESAVCTQGIEPDLAIRLVLGVARLGEADLEGWWSSQGMNPAVRFTLAGFRRTGKVVGAELALLSATRRHRQILPRNTAVHLFSPYLPFAGWTQAYLAEQKMSGESALVGELLAWTSIDTARGELGAWVEETGLQTYAGSTISAADLNDDAVTSGLLVRFASGYLTQTSGLAVPYVDLAQ
jgi:hypothetical protein